MVKFFLFGFFRILGLREVMPFSGIIAISFAKKELNQNETF